MHSAIELTSAARMEARETETNSKIRHINRPKPRRYFSARVSEIRNPQSRNGVTATPMTAPSELGLYQKAQPAAYKSPVPKTVISQPSRSPCIKLVSRPLIAIRTPVEQYRKRRKRLATFNRA